MNRYGKILFFLVTFPLLMTGCQTTPQSQMNSDDSVAASNSSTSNETSMLPGNVIYADPTELQYTAVQEDYRIGPFDLLDISVFRAEELSAEVRVDDQGYIKMPMLGNVIASGLTHDELANKLADKMRVNLLQNPQVTVSIKEFTARRVTVEGSVNQPGVYPIKGQMTLLQAVASAGGMSNLASPTKVLLFRQAENKKVKAYQLNISDIQDGKMRDPYLKNEDRVIVHRSPMRYWIREGASLINPFLRF
jgi:polysaccharide export outer membrane protein